MMQEETVTIGEPLDPQAVSCKHFALLHGAVGRPVANWRSRYALGGELGSGQTATVFEAICLRQRQAEASGRRVARLDVKATD